MRDAVIFDMDGTLCDVSSVRHLVDGDVKDFDAFHAASMDCPPHAAVADAARQARVDGRAVLVVTSRSAKWRDYTIKWLDRHDIGYDAVYLRIEADFRADDVVKADILKTIVNDGFHPVHAWDDSPDIIELWRANGIDVTVVPS